MLAIPDSKSFIISDTKLLFNESYNFSASYSFHRCTILIFLKEVLILDFFFPEKSTEGESKSICYIILVYDRGPYLKYFITPVSRMIALMVQAIKMFDNYPFH